jgi:AcrR family transcriptional regulator
MTKRLPLTPKREPAQARSRDMVQRILDAALRVLKASGIEGFTNNHVAAEAEVSVASVYQFFPNKQAIIYRLYSDWLATVTARLTAEIDMARDEPDWQTFAIRLSDVLAEEAVDRHAEYELVRAMWSHRELIDLDQQHAQGLGAKVAQTMRRYGSTLNGRELIGLATFANELHTLVAERAMHGTDIAKRRLDEYARVAYLALWGHALGRPVTSNAPPARPAPRIRAASTTRAEKHKDRKRAAVADEDA